MMPAKSKAQLAAENFNLLARVTELELKLIRKRPGEEAPLSTEASKARLRERDFLSSRREALTEAIRTAPVGTWTWDVPTGEVTWSNELYEIFGMQHEEQRPLYEAVLRLVHPDDRDFFEASLRNALANGTPFRFQTRLMRLNGVVRQVVAEGQVDLDAGGKPVRLSGTFNDVTDVKRLEDSLRSSEIRYRRLFETAKDGILILDADTGKITDANPFLKDLLGYEHDELIDKCLWELGPFKDIAESKDAFRQLQANEYIRYENLPLETKTKGRREVEFVSNVYLEDGRRVIQCNVRDITERKQTENGMRKLNDDLLALVSELQRRDGEMKHLNRMHDLLQTCTSQEEACRVITLMAAELFQGQEGCLAIKRPFDNYLEMVASWGNPTQVQTIFPLEDCWAMRRGQPHEVLDSSSSLFCKHFVVQPTVGYLCVPLTVQGETLGLMSLVGAPSRNHGHSQQQLVVTVGEAIKLSLSNLRLREKLREQVTHDPLTGLFNRRYLEESLPREIHRAQRDAIPLCVAMLDLDHFKEFNDSYGHEAGDLLLREVGQLFNEKLRKSDISCRYGGEEFVLVLPHSTMADTLLRVEQVRLLVKNLEFRMKDRTLGNLTLSVGIAQAGDHGTSAGELLRAADEAMYDAKRAGRDRIMVYESK